MLLSEDPMRSDIPFARPFQDWLTREVVPAIRKDGAYIIGEETEAAIGGMGSRSRLQGMTERPLH